MDKSESGPKPKVLRRVGRACELNKLSYDRWDLVQRIDTGLVVGNVGPAKDGSGVFFAPDGAQYLLSAGALREIADLIDLHGVELAS